MIVLIVTRLQVFFDTAASAAASLEGAPLPVRMHMHGSDGVTPALHFDNTQGGSLSVHDCTAQAVGDLHQLTVWVDPAMVRTSSYRFGLPPCWIVTWLATQTSHRITQQLHQSIGATILESSACDPAYNVLFEARCHCNVNRQQLVLTCVVNHETLPWCCMLSHDSNS